MTAYDSLKARFARVGVIGEAETMLGWDAAAMMPSGGAEARGEQMAVLAGLAHELMTAPAMADDLAAAMPQDDPWDAANLGLMRHAHRRATALPLDLVEARARVSAACETVWRTARATNDFNLVRPYLEDVIGLTRQAAALLGAALGQSPYDALMDSYQPGIGSADVTPLFDRYEAFLGETLPLAEQHQAAQPDPVPMDGHFPAAAQEALCRTLSLRVGLEEEHSRLDRSTHPFCGGTPTDIRITTRYDETDPAMAVLGVLHESGHALYERGLPARWARQPVGSAAGMAVHESQSLIIEMQACRSDAFLAWLGPVLQARLGRPDPAFAVSNLARLWRRVERGFIRTDADELTYPAHVILRFRLEQALIGGTLRPADLPDAWAAESRRLLGVVPPDDTRGCLQDIHWYDGAFGYFPSYTLGAMAAAQLMGTARRDVPSLDDAVGRGDLSPLVVWLRPRVHGQGSRHGFNDLLRQATGTPLDPGFFEAHLRRRYLP